MADLLQVTGNMSYTPATINTLNNYGYDPLGNLIRDNREKIANIVWSVAGKVLQVDHTPGQGLKNLKFGYGAHGHRISKSVFEDGNPALAQRTWYIHDAQGNVMANYLYQPALGSFALIERPLYGSDRLGVDTRTLETFGEPSIAFDPRNQQPAATKGADLLYELKDHLGNVAVVITGDRYGVDQTPQDTYVDYYMPKVVSWAGYEPFGSLLPGRNYSSGSYRFGFNGQEKDDEVFGATGTSMTAEFWQYDTRTGKRWNIDPEFSEFPQFSPYLVFNGNPIFNTDPKGNKADGYVDENGNYLGDDGDTKSHDTRVITKATWGRLNGDKIQNGKDNATMAGIRRDRLQDAENSTRLQAYEGGVNISSGTWSTLVSKGGIRLLPTVDNTSADVVFYKPDDSENPRTRFDDALPVQPHTQLFHPIDGVKTRATPDGSIFKVREHGRVQINPNGSVTHLNPVAGQDCNGQMTRGACLTGGVDWDRLDATWR